jgi:glycosyltransferase involved in cell wall biosynthesis/GT2 family glycosyltransferase
VKVLRISHSAVVSAWRQRERQLRRRGVDVSLVSSRVWNEGGAPVVLRPETGEEVSGAGTLGRHPNVFLYDPRPLWRALGRPWDVIDIHEEPCSLAAAEVLLLRRLRRSRAPYVLYSAQNIEKRYPAPFRWFERWALVGASGVSVCNVRAGEILRGKGLRAGAGYVPLGIDTGLFTPADRPPPTGPITIGYVGRLDDHKGVDILLAAVAGDDRLRLQIIGAGPSEPRLRKLAVELNADARVEFRGHVEAEDLAVHYQGFDAVAVPSLPTASWLEQFCRVAVEAMAAGVPVVASRTGAIPDVVGDAAVLVEPGDAEALRDALLSLTLDPSRWTELRAAGLARAGRFTWQAVAVEQQRLYEAALSRSRPGVSELAEPAERTVEVVVVAYGSTSLLSAALEPLAGEFPLTVVDNSSSVETRALVERAAGRYLDPGRNLGFAAGVNYALRRLQHPRADILLLNPDARISAADVQVLHKALGADPSLACVGPAQVDGTGVAARVEWPFPSPLSAWRDAAGLSRRHGRSGFVIGSVLLLRREALDAVGLLDQRFFLYAEETDWQRRALNAGFRPTVVNDVVATHTGGATSNDPARRETHAHASLEKYVRKHSGALGWQFLRAGVLAGSLARTVLARGDRRSALRRLRLYLRGPMRAERMLTADVRHRAPGEVDS